MAVADVEEASTCASCCRMSSNFAQVCALVAMSFMFAQVCALGALSVMMLSVMMHSDDVGGSIVA
jgi:hypothetical protein